MRELILLESDCCYSRVALSAIQPRPPAGLGDALCGLVAHPTSRLSVVLSWNCKTRFRDPMAPDASIRASLWDALLSRHRFLWRAGSLARSHRPFMRM